MLCVDLTSTVENFVMLQAAVRNLWDFKHLKMGQNLHANMEGLLVQSHILPIVTLWG